jgi:hypothetical protein
LSSSISSSANGAVFGIGEEVIPPSSIEGGLCEQHAAEQEPREQQRPEHVERLRA